jgi:5-methylcytosine-specific restriction enzyme subunit McrC
MSRPGTVCQRCGSDGRAVRITLTEAGPAARVELDERAVHTLVASKLVDVLPDPATGWWRVRPAGQVGAARVGGVELFVEPKTPVANLVFLLGYARDPSWRPDTVPVDSVSGLVPAFAEALWRQATAALRAGLVQGYRTVDGTGPVLRGRLREVDQMGWRLGAPTPLETRHDDFTVDIPENQVLAAAVDRMLRVPGVPEPDRRMLRHLAVRFAEVRPLRRGEPVPGWVPSRLNARYHVALRLAELVLDAASVATTPGAVVSNGLMVDMARLFEDFLTAALRVSIERRHGGRVVGQRRDHLDVAGAVEIRPDIAWRHCGGVAAVVDAKYKTYTPSADVYQMLAYCIRYRLARGHLVYVTGDRPARGHRIRNSDVEIHMHGVDLAQPPDVLLREIDLLADRIVG